MAEMLPACEVESAQIVTSIAGFCQTQSIWATFSSRVIRPSRSAVRSSALFAGSRYASGVGVVLIV
jgi:hypothetical protein